ncbi:MAG TPA: hypothetical protein VKK79_20010 [Candidatus Lokiarchaeia archaeon]|nr:hypothetical protein [Candidatus Lokiarchaeia archaeon]
MVKKPVNDVCVDDVKCLGCEQCSVACARINDQDPEDRKCWNIRMVNGVATIMDVGTCKANQEWCRFICLKNCPTKALSAQIAGILNEENETDTVSEE